MTNENAILDAKAELQKAQSALRAARALSELELFDDAASRLYYAAFHQVSAALLALGIQAQTHAGLAVLLGQHLVKPGLLSPSVSHDLAALLGLRGQEVRVDERASSNDRLWTPPLRQGLHKGMPLYVGQFMSVRHEKL